MCRVGCPCCREGGMGGKWAGALGGTMGGMGEWVGWDNGWGGTRSRQDCAFCREKGREGGF